MSASDQQKQENANQSESSSLESEALDAVTGGSEQLDELPIQKVDHLAIAVWNVNRALTLYHGLFGMEVEGIEEVESEQVRSANLHCGNLRVELLEPLEGEGPIQTFLEKEGPGLHHICLRVNDIKRLEEKFREAGYEPVYDETRKGVENAKINFLHPHDTFGVLIELREVDSDEASESGSSS